MALDAYSFCPGGTGKKIKFCCPDFLPELQKIDRMLDGEQYMACLQHIEHLREQSANRDRPCLLAQETYLLRLSEQHDAAKKLALEFLEKHPTNQTALAECCIAQAGDGDLKKALSILHRGFREANGSVTWRLYEAAKFLVVALLNDNKIIAARELLQFLSQLGDKDQSFVRLVVEFYESPDVPLLLKDGGLLPTAPADVPWQQRYNDAIACAHRGDWETALSTLTTLSKEVPNSPVVWKALARARGAMGDNEGCIAALRKDVAVDSSLEETVESEARAMLLSENPLGDLLDMMQVGWTVKDAEKLHEALLSESKLRPVPFNPAALATEDSPPPKAVFMVLDRPLLDSADEVTFENMPCFLGQLLLFGKQTDRDARLELVGLVASELPVAKTMIAALGGEWLDPQTKEEVIGHVSASEDLLKPQWRPPQALPIEKLKEFLIAYHRQALLQRWPNMKLGCLDGKTPREALAEGVYKVRVLAAILVFEEIAESLRCRFDFNELRTKLGLPVLGPIDSESVNPLTQPMSRLSRLLPEKLNDEQLKWAFRMASGYRIHKAIRIFGEELIRRPSYAGKPEMVEAYSRLAEEEENFDRALEYVEAGRQALEKIGSSHVTFDFQELHLRYARRDPENILRLIQHIDRVHGNEPEVSQMLTQTLIQFGMLRPDGTPAFPMRGAAPEEMPVEPAAEPGKLWTPDSVASDTGGGSKLWTPD
jgi:tetratricopeptide (TPR) repeat protein